jgi:MFS family permease
MFGAFDVERNWMNSDKSIGRNIILDYWHTFLRNINLTHGIWMPYLHIIKGYSLVELGVFEATFHISSISMEVPTGIFGDLIGRKASRILGVLLLIIYVFLLLISNNIIMILIAFFICGIGYAFESGTGEALIYDSLVKIRKTNRFIKIQGNKEILYQIASTTALFLGGLIAYQSFELVFKIMIILYILALVPLFKMIEINENVQSKTKLNINKVYEQIKKSTEIMKSNKNFTSLIFLAALILAPVTTVFFFLSTHLLDDGTMMIQEVGIILGLHALMGAIGGGVAHRLEKIFGIRILYYIIPVLIITCLWLFTYERIIIYSFIIIGFFDSVFYVVLSDRLNKEIPSSQRATLLSINNFAFSIVMIILFPIFGYFADAFSMSFAFSVLAIVVMTAYILFIHISKRNNNIYFHNKIT